MIIYFDLPSVTNEELKSYRAFRKFLLSEGFVMMQESVYSKLVLNPSIAESTKRRIVKNKPPSGLLQLLVVTEQQFAKIEYIVGRKVSKVIDGEERLVIL